MSKTNETKERIESGVITSFFDCLSDLLLKYTDGKLHIISSDFNKHFSRFMVCRYLSMRTNLVNIAEYLNSMQTILTNEQFYVLAYKLIPKQSSAFIKYIKSAKQKEKIKNIDNNIPSDDTNLALFDL